MLPQVKARTPEPGFLKLWPGGRSPTHICSGELENEGAVQTSWYVVADWEVGLDSEGSGEWSVWGKWLVAIE